MSFSVQGEFTSATVFASKDSVSDAVMSQLYTLVNHPACTEPIRVMPDVHPSGAALVGFSMPLNEQIIPELVGGDIGCGMSAWKLEDDLPFDLEKRDKLVRKAVPGRGRYSSSIDVTSRFPFEDAMTTLRQFKKSYRKKFDVRVEPPFEFSEYNGEYLMGLIDRIDTSATTLGKDAGTLGGGNHFVEFGKSRQSENYWVVIHSGSRRLGKSVAKYWEEKTDGHHSLGWLEGQNAHGYFVDMIFCQTFASWNRSLMGAAVADVLSVEYDDSFESVHNYIDFDDLVIRKGSTRSYTDERIVIPIDAESGILVCRGTNNPDGNHSAPHGAGRVLSRGDAKQMITPEDFKNAVGDVYVDDVDKSIVSEAPQAYKDADYLLNHLDGLAEPIDVLDPVHNIKHR